MLMASGLRRLLLAIIGVVVMLGCSSDPATGIVVEATDQDVCVLNRTGELPDHELCFSLEQDELLEDLSVGDCVEYSLRGESVDLSEISRVSCDGIDEPNQDDPGIGTTE